MKPGVQTDGRTGDHFDHDDRYGSFSSPQDRKIASLRYQAAAADHYYRNIKHMAAAQSAEIAQALDDWGHDQAQGYHDGSRPSRTLATAPDMDAIPDNSWVDDDKVDGLSYDDHGRGRRGQGRAATGQFPSSATFTDGSTIKVRKYKRKAWQQAELDRYEAAIGTPVLKYSPDELARLGLTRSTAPFDLQFLF
jgi:hypothetical protein